VATNLKVFFIVDLTSVKSLYFIWVKLHSKIAAAKSFIGFIVRS